MSWTPITHISISAECSKDVEKVAKHHKGYVRDYSAFVWNQAGDEEKIEAKKKIGIICLLRLDEKKEKMAMIGRRMNEKK